MKMEIARQEANANLARGEAEAKVIVMRGKGPRKQPWKQPGRKRKDWH